MEDRTWKERVSPKRRLDGTWDLGNSCCPQELECIVHLFSAALGTDGEQIDRERKTNERREGERGESQRET